MAVNIPGIFALFLQRFPPPLLIDEIQYAPELLPHIKMLVDRSRQPGQFYAVHSIATDSKGNIFTTETYRGQRVQKFVYKGLGSITKVDKGVVWPSKK